MYIEDALGDRVWVDLDPCKELVANMCTLFGTKPYTPGQSNSGPLSGSVKASEVGKSGADEGSEISGGEGDEFNKDVSLSGIEIVSRYVNPLH